MTRTFTVMRLLRERAGMSQAELARLIGVTQPRISSWENRRAVVPAMRITEIALLLGTSPDKLLLDAAFVL